MNAAIAFCMQFHYEIQVDLITQRNQIRREIKMQRETACVR